MIDEGGEKGEVRVGNQQRCRVGSVCFQSLGVTVDLIIQFPDGFFDTDPVGFTHRKAVHDFRYGAQRDTGFFCHIFHCRGGTSSRSRRLSARSISHPVSGRMRAGASSYIWPRWRTSTLRSMRRPRRTGHPYSREYGILTFRD